MENLGLSCIVWVGILSPLKVCGHLNGDPQGQLLVTFSGHRIIISPFLYMLFILYVCTCECGGVHVYMCGSMFVHVEARSQSLMLFLRQCPLVVYDRVAHWPGTCQSG